MTNQVFIARIEDQNVGYIWVGQVRRVFTGEMQAHILNLFVTNEFRGQGVGARLLKRAEAWAREHHLTRIGLSVAAHNSIAIGLYEKLGYEIETQRMIKILGDA
ncbi:MAG: GNAT family N-acetyltransferase [Anaerolineae bacterium]|nr:GNAT family N-acetyltransferase [Anaerolineae bacterium]